MADVTAEQVAAAEDALRSAAKSKRKEAANKLAQIRQAYRRQEEAAGRRIGPVSVTSNGKG